MAPERITNENVNTDIRYRLYYTRKIELHRKGKKSRTVRITPILICGICCSPHPTGKCGTRPFLWWVQVQGRSPHAPGICQKCLRPRRHSPYYGRLRRWAINPSLLNEVKAGEGKAPWDRRKSPGTETHLARSVPQITRPAEVLPDTWRGVRPILICGIWCTPHLTSMYGTRLFFWVGPGAGP